MINCTGHFHGEIIGLRSKSGKSILFVTRGANPDIEYFFNAFDEISNSHFHQCIVFLFYLYSDVDSLFLTDIGSDKQLLCPSCIKEHFHDRDPTRIEEVGTFQADSEVLVQVRCLLD